MTESQCIFTWLWVGIEKSGSLCCSCWWTCQFVTKSKLLVNITCKRTPSHPYPKTRGKKWHSIRNHSNLNSNPYLEHYQFYLQDNHQLSGYQVQLRRWPLVLGVDCGPCTPQSEGLSRTGSLALPIQPCHEVHGFFPPVHGAAPPKSPALLSSSADTCCRKSNVKMLSLKFHAVFLFVVLERVWPVLSCIKFYFYISGI